MSTTTEQSASMPAGLPALAQSYAVAVPELSLPHQADPVPAPRLLALNDDLARQLGLDPAALRTEPGLRLLTGALDAHGRPLPEAACQAQPEPPFTTAQAYAGYQFGQPNPQLGDGRALLLGDALAADGQRYDLHLKGSGPTPFARAGDGKAPLGPMLRELLVGEAMSALDIPSTRGLAVVATGEGIRRRGPLPEPGAILTRVAASHLRVGTFEFAAWHHGPPVLEPLAAYAIRRHWPQAQQAACPALELLRCVTRAQADLVARWMLVGFVHGVMNTDNMTISGQSIDFGPCAFLDTYRADAVFSSIDQQGRYAYRNQPGIALWNLSRLAEALLPLIDAGDLEAAVAQATGVLQEYEGAYLASWTRGMAAKLGIPLTGDDTSLAEIRALGEDCLRLLEQHEVDFTGFFRALGDERARDLFSEPEGFDAWAHRRAQLLGRCDPDAVRAAGEQMARVNPLYICRNHHLDAALRAAEAGDLAPFERLLHAVREPYSRRPELADLEGPGTDPAPFVTYCGT